MAKRKSHFPGDTEESQVRMGFGEHLEELRKRLINSLLGSAGLIILCLYYSKDIVQLLLEPYRIALAAETGMLRGHIVTQNLTFAARKGAGGRA